MKRLFIIILFINFCLFGYSFNIRNIAPSVYQIKCKYDNSIYIPTEKQLLVGFGGFNLKRLVVEKKIDDKQCTGFAIKENGYILVPYSFVKDATAIYANDYKKKQFKAEYVGKFKEGNIAIIKIDAKTKPLKLTEDNFEVFDTISSLGYPEGLGMSYYTGMIGGKNLFSVPISDLRDLFQIDIVINPGLEGSPVFNEKEEVIGIAQKSIYEGLGFTIPINDVKQYFDEILLKKDIKLGWLGIAIYNLDGYGREEYDISDDNCSYIRWIIPNSPADKAGIKTGSIVVSIDNKNSNNLHSIQNYIMNKNVGETVTIVVKNKEGEMTFNLPVEERPEKFHLHPLDELYFSFGVKIVEKKGKCIVSTVKENSEGEDLKFKVDQKLRNIVPATNYKKIKKDDVEKKRYSNFVKKVRIKSMEGLLENLDKSFVDDYFLCFIFWGSLFSDGNELFTFVSIPFVI
jgi:S1-C subfamily serine protease